MGGKSGSKKRASKSKEVPQENAANQKFKVEKIVGDRIIKGKTQYKVHWAGYSTEDETWENESQLDCNELLEEYIAELSETNEEADGRSNERPSRSGRSSGQGHENSKRSRKEDSYADDKGDSEEESEPEEKAAVTPKKGRSSGGGKSQGTSKQDPSSPPQGQSATHTEYTVEKIVGDRKKNGKTQYLVHWEGYTTEEETWENSSQLNCQEAINDYLSSKSGADGDDEEKEKKTAKKRTAASKKNPSGETSKRSKPGPVNGENEYEVERIIEMHTSKTGVREFLVRWKGFGKEGDTWEPEEHLLDTELLDKFLQKVEKAKEIPAKELRMHRKPTDRFTAMPQGDKRRQSKRHAQHQRVKYYDAE